MPVLRFDIKSRAISTVVLPPPPPQTIRSVGAVLAAAVVYSVARSLGTVKSTGAVLAGAVVTGRAIAPVVATRVASITGTAVVTGIGASVVTKKALGSVVGSAEVNGVPVPAPATDEQVLLLVDANSSAGSNLTDDSYYQSGVRLKSGAWLTLTDSKFGAGSVQCSTSDSTEPFTAGIGTGEDSAYFAPVALRRMLWNEGAGLTSDVTAAYPEGWTLECWMKIATADGGGYILWVETGDGGLARMTGAGLGLRRNAAGKLEAFGGVLHDGTSYAHRYDRSVSPRDFPIDQWLHVAFVMGKQVDESWASGKTGKGTYQVFVNGINDFELVGGYQRYTGLVALDQGDTMSRLGLGRVYFGKAFNGKIDTLRITEGRRYIRNFTPPGAAFTAGIKTDSYGANTGLLLHCDGAHGSTTVVDSSLRALPVSAHGGVSVSTAQSKFGGASLSFDGTGRLEIPYSRFTDPVWDVTIEFWVRLTSHPGGALPIVSFKTTSHPVEGSQDIVIRAVKLPDNSIVMSVLRGPMQMLHLESPLTLDQWHHVSVVGGSNPRLYVDGVASLHVPGAVVPGAITLPFGWNWSGAVSGYHPMRIGGDLTSPSGLIGFLDELWLFQGTARTGNFVPPTSPQPNPTAS